MFEINQQTKLVLAGLLLAIGLILPIVFHSYAIAGSVFLPMHIPVLLTGFICGWKYGLAVGIIVPFLSSILAGIPPMFPIAVGMAFELSTYGLVTGILSRRKNIYVTLIAAMVAGRMVLGIANAILFGFFTNNSYTWSMFISGAFVTALPGIIIQLIIIPVILMALKQTKLFGSRMS